MSKPILVLAALAAAAGAAHAQTAAMYPTKPIRLVLPYPPGGGTDLMARPLAQRMSENMKQQVVVENRGGASGNLGMEHVARQPPDGYTFVFALTAQLAVNPSLFKKLPYDPLKDFAPITLLAEGPYVLTVHPSLPAKSVKELIALARARPDQITYASSGSGGGAHLATALMTHMAEIKMIHVPYKGAGLALVDVMAGHVQMIFASYAATRPHIETGRLRALAVSTNRRLPGLELPTVAEAALPGYDAGVWYAFLAPAGTPREIVMRLHGEIRRAAEHPDFKALLARSAVEPILSSPEELSKFIKSEIAKWAKVLRDANVQVD